jgi:hypothetical protein
MDIKGMTAMEKAERIVQEWTKRTCPRAPYSELRRLIAEAIDAVEQSAYERGYEDGQQDADVNTWEVLRNEQI